MNLFSLLFAILLALAFVLLLMLFFEAVERERHPKDAPDQATRALLWQRSGAANAHQPVKLRPWQPGLL